MAVRQVVVDGSNLATEGRSFPSLAQLDEAVRDFMAENPDANVIVVVDASFGHRIGASEGAAFEAAEEAGEVVSPPAGATGHGGGGGEGEGQGRGGGKGRSGHRQRHGGGGRARRQG